MSELTISQASKYYNSHRALEDVTLALPKNKITAIIGRSGCGKSTLLKLLNGLEKPDTGSVSIFGQAIEQRVKQLLELMQLSHRQLGQYPHELSGGQQQRVGLCRAMMLNPPVLLLDEAFAALDPLTRAEIHQQLMVLHKAEPRTIILVTHDMQEALTLADDIVIMEEGSVTLHQAKEELLCKHSHADANALLLSLMSREPESDAL